MQFAKFRTLAFLTIPCSACTSEDPLLLGRHQTVEEPTTGGGKTVEESAEPSIGGSGATGGLGLTRGSGATGGLSITGGSGATGGSGNPIGGATAITAHDPNLCFDGSPVPSSIGAKQSVTVKLRNDSGEDRFVVTQGPPQACTKFGIWAVTGEGKTAIDLTQPKAQTVVGHCTIPTNIVCDIPSPAPTELVKLGPGQSYSLKWDAREFAHCGSSTPACPELESVRHGGLQPVPAGQYRIELSLYSTLPPYCKTSGNQDTFNCSPYPTNCYSDVPVCGVRDRTSSASADFSVPASGDVTVEIPLT